MNATEANRLHALVQQEVSSYAAKHGVSEREAFSERMSALRKEKPHVWQSYVKWLMTAK